MKLFVRIIIMVSVLLMCREGYLCNINNGVLITHTYKSNHSQADKSRRLKAVNPHETEEDDNEDEDDLSFRLHAGCGIELFPFLRQLLLPSGRENSKQYVHYSAWAHSFPNRHILYQVFRV